MRPKRTITFVNCNVESSRFDEHIKRKAGTSDTHTPSLGKRTSLNEVNLIQTYVGVDDILVTVLPQLSRG
ncbi:hypothetical protein Ac2012v2_005458 [Leucoagaricus gongylophorus]